MESFVVLYLILALLLLIWFAIWTAKLVCQKRVQASSMLGYSLFCLFASVLVFGLASYGLEAAHLTQKEYILSLFGVRDFAQLTKEQLNSFQSVFVSQADRPLLLRLIAEQALAAFVKFFVPICLAAIGVWALEKYLEKQIEVVADVA